MGFIKHLRRICFIKYLRRIKRIGYISRKGYDQRVKTLARSGRTRLQAN